MTLEIPGKCRFDALSNKRCAAVATMMKIGPDAMFCNMGACPDAQAGCDATTGGVPATCDACRVDIGAHWELAMTKQGVTCPINAVDGTGDDLVANKDDECAVSPCYRLDDDGDGAGNEWAGGRSHSAGTEEGGGRSHSAGTEEGADGTYTFELSRLLVTASSATDAQMMIGEMNDFGGECGWA
jgi:hypothetical protein